MATSTVSSDLAPQRADGARGQVLLGVTGTVLVLAEFVWFALASAHVVDSGGDAWQTGDWLINLAGGPVRRGVLGEMLFRISNTTDVVWVVFWVQIGLSALLMAATLTLFWTSPRTPAWFMLTFSPAFLLFPFLSPEGGLRKELLGLVAFAVLALAVRFSWHPGTLAVVVGFFLLGALAHELNPLLLPPFVYLLVWAYRNGLWRRSVVLVVGIALSVIAVGALAWTLRFPATPQIVSDVCRSWLNAGLDGSLCSGSLRFLAQDASDAVSLTRQMFPSYITLVPLVVLSLAPLYLVGATRWIWWLLAVSVVAMAPLYVLAIDYGRWIHVAVALVSLTCLATWPQESFRSRAAPVWAAILFVSLWSLPYAGPQTSQSLLSQLATGAYEALFGPAAPTIFQR